MMYVTNKASSFPRLLLLAVTAEDKSLIVAIM